MTRTRQPLCPLCTSPLAEQIQSVSEIEEAVEETAQHLVARMFKFVFDVVHSLAPGFQVIITEHADLVEEWYQQAVIERWRRGEKLVPVDGIPEEGFE